MTACKLRVRCELTAAARSWAGAREAGAWRTSRDSTGLRLHGARGAPMVCCSSSVAGMLAGSLLYTCGDGMFGAAGTARLLQRGDGMFGAVLLRQLQRAGLGMVRWSRRGVSEAPKSQLRPQPRPNALSDLAAQRATLPSQQMEMYAPARIYAHGKTRQLAPSLTPQHAHQLHESVVLPRAQQLCAVDHLRGCRVYD